MTLETMAPNPVWVEDAYVDTVETLSAHADDLVFKVWGGDWCKDCRSQLPDFGAALDAAEIPGDQIEHYEVEKDDDGSKVGPLVDEYDVEFIPTVVVERAGADGDADADSGQEIARFVEEEPIPIAVHLAEQIDEALE